MKFLLLLSLISVSLASVKASAISIDWSGVYRIEYTEVDRPSLGDIKERKAYGTNTLLLGARIIPTDGVEIISQISLFPHDNPAYADSYIGSQWGRGNPTGVSSDGSRTNTLSKSSPGSNPRVQRLYMQYTQDNGAFIVGRAPVDFGLGMTHSAGNGLFDHWQSNRDLIGYKFIIDSFYIMPIFTRVYDKDFAQGEDVTEQIINFKYDNKDNGTLLGLWHQTRKSSIPGNDVIPGNAATSKIPQAATIGSGFTSQTVNFVIGRTWETFSAKVEASFLSGETGAYTAANQEIKLAAYGIASEFAYKPLESKWSMMLKAGIASGDDPTTSNYEGFQFNKNYDVAMLMFNHRVGKFDALTTNLVKDSSLGLSNSADDEAIGNAVYISPSVTYQYDDKFDFKNTLTYGQLVVNPTNAVDFSKNLGLEWDIELTYKPRANVQWVNQLGLLFPGRAFRNGAAEFETATTLGLSSKAAISF